MADAGVFIDMGWANGWVQKPRIVQECQKAHHSVEDVDVGPKYRGLEHVVRCYDCRYVYRYDSSD